MVRVPLQLRYRPRAGMVAWAFHRLSGVGIFLFVLLHVVDIYLAGANPALYDEVLAFYASIPGRILETVLGAALLYHALNGLRIVTIDFWPRLSRYHRGLWRLNWILFILIGIPVTLVIARQFLRSLGWIPA